MTKPSRKTLSALQYQIPIKKYNTKKVFRTAGVEI